VVNKDNVDEFVESNWEDLSNDLLALESIKEERKSSLEELEPVKALTIKVRYQAFKLIDSAMVV
jgi:hypothetical protein